MDGRRVFCKGVPIEPGRRLRMLRTEAEVAVAIPGLGADLLWSVEADGWLCLGFAHLDGRSAEWGPGSSDLPRIAEHLRAIDHVRTPSPIPAQPLGERWRLSYWERFGECGSWSPHELRTLREVERATPALVAGHSLQHTDMTRHNFRVGDGFVRLVDWSWPAMAAPWVDVALLVHRVIEAGHAPDAAEAWAATVPLWADAPGEGVTALAVTMLSVWQGRERSHTAAPHHRGLARAARVWVRHRLGLVGERRQADVW
ncbi:hypothetical protein [Streptomyces sp. NPDC005438]|uniref:hypothetical protein n=1 Tax=Streptomyces sp. NPDC005438 TaxID=3156880 RepID=UPI0033B0B987